MGTQYIEVEDAIQRPGLRLVLTAGVPGPWGESAKGILAVKGIQYVAVRQTAATADPQLIEWTRQSSAPAAMFEEERPRSGWAEILLLAERIQPEPALIPWGGGQEPPPGFGGVRGGGRRPLPPVRLYYLSLRIIFL